MYYLLCFVKMLCVPAEVDLSMYWLVSCNEDVNDIALVNDCALCCAFVLFFFFCNFPLISSIQDFSLENIVTPPPPIANEDRRASFGENPIS